MTIQLIKMPDEKNKINKNVSNARDFTGTLRDGTDVVNPSILVESSVNAVCGYNYAYIPEFKRYYFINNVSSFRNSLTVVSMTVDVLTTYKSSILTADCIISRSSANGDEMLDLPDDRFCVKQSEKTHVYTFNPVYTNGSGGGTVGQTMVLLMTGIDG